MVKNFDPFFLKPSRSGFKPPKAKAENKQTAKGVDPILPLHFKLNFIKGRKFLYSIWSAMCSYKAIPDMQT